MTENTLQNSADHFPVFNPHTGDVVDKAPNWTEAEIADALARAHAWHCQLDGHERASILHKAAARIDEERDGMARLISLESGLCLQNAQKEVRRALDCLRLGAVQAEEIDGIDQTAEYVRDADPKAPKLTVISEPLDLIVGITPFNHPLNAVAHKVVPAIAAGAAMVLKPSEKTPLTAVRFGRILVEAGLPEDMLIVVTGSPPERVGEQLVSFPGLDLVTFTGSLETGKAIARMMAAGNELTRYIPELGGNACFVVMDDCDVEAAANIALSAFENSGQRCTAIRKILLHDAIAEQFLECYVELARAIRYGDPLDPETQMGTVITESQATLIERRVNDAVASGARLLLGNQRQGALYSPTIVDHVRPEFELADKESFGPVASIIRISDLDDAIAINHRGRYRLASAIATSDGAKAARLHREIAVGQFSWNGPPGYRTEQAPFGGFGDSGNGEKEGIIMTTRAYRRIRTYYDHNVST